MLTALLWLGLAGAAPLSAETVAALSGSGCTLCHVVPEVPKPTRSEGCQDCHVWIREVAADPGRRAKAMEHFPLWERYERHVEPYQQTPSLPAAMARLEPAWVERYLADPYDLRPHLPETMPRTHLSPEVTQALLDGFRAGRAEVPPAPPPSFERVDRGEALFRGKGCAACHTFGGRHTEARLAMAPDLAHTRDRLSADMAAAWIADPRSVSTEATMPALGLSPDEVLALRDYVLLADPGSRLAAPALAALPTIDREVRWAEVEERVFGRVCVHCHMDPSQNQGRAGPGNAGGFGWEATGIELQTPEGVAAVADRVVAAMLRRRHEAARDLVGPGERPAPLVRPERPGMPLGLPPIPDEELALVQAWIAQGMPR